MKACRARRVSDFLEGSHEAEVIGELWKRGISEKTDAAC